MQHRKRFLNPGEAEALVALVAREHPETMIEFGCNEGRTSRLLLDSVQSLQRYVGVDVTPGYVTSKEVQRREVPTQPGWMAKSHRNFELLLSERGTLDLGADDLPAADVVFIDGDHGRAAVEHDTALARQLVRAGGLIIWHDYHNLGTVDVRDVLEDMHAAGAPIQHVEGTWLAFEIVDGI